MLQKKLNSKVERTHTHTHTHTHTQQKYNLKFDHIIVNLRCDIINRKHTTV